MLDFLAPREHLETFTAFVGGLKAFGGNDAPEDVHSGLDAASRLSWSASARLVMHFCDAPGHGLVPHLWPGMKDEYPYGNPISKGLLSTSRLLLMMCLCKACSPYVYVYRLWLPPASSTLLAALEIGMHERGRRNNKTAFSLC